MSENQIVYNQKNISLPDTLNTTLEVIQDITDSLKVPRDVLASDDEIMYAWRDLPREIMRIPPELRNELTVRMCIATSVGLFDSALNYIWNSVIISLRKKIENFGFSFVGQTLNKKFEESDLNNLRDSELLDLCYKLKLLSEDGYFLLNQCRDIRNNFSSAHPSMARIDDRELIVFISRCCKYGIGDDYALKGIDVPGFLSSIKGRKLSSDEIDIWVQNLHETFSAQRTLLVPMLMGIYCDSESSETTRLNALRICSGISSLFDDSIKSQLIIQYNDYFVNGKKEKWNAAKIFFEKLNLINLLSTSDQHAIVKNACDNLLNAHNGFNNFYNEPPFAERLYELSKKNSIPETVQSEYVYAVLMGYVGNGYGVSNAAVKYYKSMIENFSPREIGYMIDLLKSKTLFSYKVNNFQSCKTRYLEALNIVDKESMSPKQLAAYNSLLKELII